MTRRDLLKAALPALAFTSFPHKLPSADDWPDAYLAETPYLDIQSPHIRDTAAQLTAPVQSDRQAALAIFTFVRDQIPFGFASGFWDQTASDVLAVGRGYCMTKSTLFVALLRASGIPARQVFVDIDAAVLEGLIDPGTTFVDHAYSEVFLDGAWRSTDAYIVDTALFEPAQARVIAEEKTMGYGVHATGSSSWDGLTPTYAQYNMNDPRPLGSRRWGLYQDVGAFYAEAEQPWNRLNAIARFGFSLFAAQANGAAKRLRQGRSDRAADTAATPRQQGPLR